MLSFYGRMYDSTLGSWVDDDFRVYSIATLKQEISLPLYPDTTTTSMWRTEEEVLPAFDYNPDTDVARNFELQYKKYNALHELRICLTNDKSRNYISRDTGQYNVMVNYEGSYFNIIRWVPHTSDINWLMYFNIEGDPNSTSLRCIGGSISQNLTAYPNGEWCTLSAYTNDSKGRPSFIDALKNLLALNPTPSDPYLPGGESGPGGGGGDFDSSSDAVDIPPLPLTNASSTGFITLYNPSIAQLKDLCSYMWSDLFDLNSLRKLFANPMDAVLGLSIVPVAVPNGEVSEVHVGNISTGISMTKAANQYVEVDCGSMNVKEFWGAYLDYDPFTKAEIYLPYIGTHPLSVDDIMGKTIHVVYHVDILSGACCAFVKCGDSVLYSFIGQCSASIPISGNDWTNVINGVLSVAGSIGSMVATGGASSPMAISQIASTAVNNFKPSIEKSGSLSGSGGMLGVQYPYLILTRPRQALPSNQNKFTGYPAFMTVELSTVSGYTEIDSIHLENINATESELDEIESLLKSGVIF